MKNKDYVSQKAKKQPPRRKEQTVTRRPFPIVKFVIVLSLVAGFGYFLMQIQDKAEEIAPTAKPQVQKQKPKQVELPPPPEEEWSYIEELENKKVQVTAEELEAKGPFLMQCASFRSNDDAQSLKAQIAFAGYESQVRQTEGTSGTWYKVILGPFERKRDAEKTRHILKRNNINGCAIWLWK